MPRKRQIPRVLLLIETSRAFGRRVIDGIARYSLECGPWSIQFEDRALDSVAPDWFKEWRGNGIITRTVTPKLARLLRSTHLPVVELHGSPDMPTGIAQVRADFYLGGCMTLDHFLNCGLRHFGYFTYEDSDWSRMHREGYCQALEERGFRCHVFDAPMSKRAVGVWHERQYPRLVTWLRSLPRPAGILCYTDLHAIRLLDACLDMKITVPEEVAILGMGNDPVICETVRPTLSSLDVGGRRIGFEAAKLLARKMSGKRVDEQILVPPSHVAARQSTDLMAVEDTDVVEAMRFIRASACKGINVDAVARQVGLSRRCLEQRFCRHLGRGPKAEILRMQIEHAKRLLTKTEQTLESVAHRSGFASMEYFARAFRREAGAPPHAYRRTQRIAHDFEDPAT